MSPEVPGSEAMVPHQAPSQAFRKIDRRCPSQRIVEGRWRPRDGHPETQHDRVHGADQGRGRIAMGVRSISQIGRVASPTLSQMPPWSGGAPVRRKKPCLAQPREVCGHQLISLLALAALGGEFGG